MTSAPISRTSLVGTRSKMPPSTSVLSPMTAGVNAPGMELEARMASMTLPSLSSTTFPAARSTAMQEKGDLEVCKGDVAEVLFKELARLVEAQQPVGADGIDVERRDLGKFQRERDFPQRFEREPRAVARPHDGAHRTARHIVGTDARFFERLQKPMCAMPRAPPEPRASPKVLRIISSSGA